MLNGEIRSQVDAIWNAFWTGGIANPLEVIEQITYLLFISRLDELQTLDEARVARTKQAPARRVFPDGNDPRGRPYADLRWSRFRNTAPSDMFVVLGEHVFPFLRTLGGDGSTYAHHMKDARFTIPTPALLSRVVDMLDKVPMQDRDTKGDLYEYMLSKIATAGQNGQFRTPRHIIQLMVEMMAPGPKDVIVDPACGTSGFLVAAGEFVRAHHPEMLRDREGSTHFHHGMFHGFDFDSTMLRIGSMNMLLHGVENPDIRYRDSLAQDHAADAERYSLVLANPPFAGALDAEAVAKDLTSIVKTRKTELLFLALFLRLLKPGGRAAVIVPDGVLFGSSKAHKELRRMLVEDHRLDGVVSLPSGVFRPYTGVSAAILLFTRTDSGGTENVWFYELRADGLSLDDKRAPLLPSEKLGAVPVEALDACDYLKNNLPDVLARWKARHKTETGRSRYDQSFLISKDEIAGFGYDLSRTRYMQAERSRSRHKAEREVFEELKLLIAQTADDVQAIEPTFQKPTSTKPVKKSWPKRKLCEVCFRITDGTHQSPAWSDSGIPFLFVANIVSGEIDYRSEKYISVETYHELTDRCPIEIGDVLYSTVGSYGVPALVRVDKKFAFQRHIAHLKPDADVVKPEFLKIILESADVKAQANRVARGAAQKTVNLRELKEFEIFCPSLDDQRQFMADLEGIYRLRKICRASIEAVEALQIFLSR